MIDEGNEEYEDDDYYDYNYKPAAGLEDFVLENDAALEDKEDEREVGLMIGRLLQEARARQREAEASLQKLKMKSKEVDMELERLRRAESEQKACWEHQEKR